MDTVYRGVAAAALASFRLMRWDVRATAVEHIPRRGPAIIAANHIGYLDFAFIGAGARLRGRLVRFLARHEAFEHWLGGPLMRAMRHIPVDREGEAAAALDASLRALEEGEVIGIHPEGAISRSYVTQPGKTGAARLSISSGAPLIPAAVWGSHRILAPGRRPRLPRDVVITVEYGEPMFPAAEEDPAGLTERLMQRVGRMVERAAAAYPQRPRQGEDRWWIPTHLGGSAPTVEESLAMTSRDAERRRARRALERESGSSSR
jgi:1-acyl-sn-glycerol-3-phosphate acyltransferase